MFGRFVSRVSLLSRVYCRRLSDSPKPDARKSLYTKFMKSSLPNKVAIVTSVIAVPTATFTWLWAERKDKAEKVEAERKDKAEKVEAERKASLSYAVENSVEFLAKPFANSDMEEELEKVAKSDNWVERSSVTKQLSKFVFGTYLLVLGEKGNGKSCGVYHFFKNSPGQLSVS